MARDITRTIIITVIIMVTTTDTTGKESRYEGHEIFEAQD
jgi:hypothetical protein